MMKQKNNDVSFLKHPVLFTINATKILEPNLWEEAFDEFWTELKNPNIKREDLIYNFAVNFNFGSELFNPERDFYAIDTTKVVWNKGMRVRLADDIDFIDKDDSTRRYAEINKFISMLNKFKKMVVYEGMPEIRFNKTISKNLFNFSKTYHNEFLDYFHRETSNGFFYEFEERELDGAQKFINRVWCRANIIRDQELCTVCPLRFGLGEEY